MRQLWMTIALLVAAPALADESPAGPNPSEATPADTLDTLRSSHARLVSERLTGDEGAGAALVMERKLDEIAAFASRVASFVATSPAPAAGDEARLLHATAELYYADLGLALRPRETLTRRERKVMAVMLENRFYPGFRAVEGQAVARLEDLVASGGAHADDASAVLASRARSRG